VKIDPKAMACLIEGVVADVVSGGGGAGAIGRIRWRASFRVNGSGEASKVNATKQASSERSIAKLQLAQR